MPLDSAPLMSAADRVKAIVSTRSRKRLALIALISLAGCSDMQSALSGSSARAGLCTPVPPARQEAAANAYQQAIQRDECIHRWAYSFAGVRDDADSVVGAVIGACRAQINRSATLLGEGDAEAERFYLEEMEAAAKERALYRVIQARAGNCR
jgi:hypothetical protein